jgi:hypothetical protein
MVARRHAHVIDCLGSMQQCHELGKRPCSTERRRRVDADPRYNLGSASTKYNPPAINIVTGRVKTHAMTMREIMP